jgi:RimJ/RimL family protein N-acetyltransferase
MIIKDYGIELNRLDRDSIEMLRKWRNDRHIREAMFYRKEISPEQQEKWYSSINNEFNFYWIICHQGKLLGMINTSHISFHGGIAYSGLFIHDPEWQSTQIPVLASLAMLDFNFQLLKLRKVLAKVRSDNPVAMRYNKSLGFETEGEIDGGFVLGLTKEKYFDTASELREIGRKNQSAPPKIIVEKMDIHNLPELTEYLLEEPVLISGYELSNSKLKEEERGHEYQSAQQHNE